MYRRVSDNVARRLLNRLYGGEWQPGERLPPEPALAAQLGVNKNTLREAVCRLQNMGVLQARRGSGVTALDYREHANLDFAIEVMCSDDDPDTTTLLEILDFFESLIPTLAKLYAEAMQHIGVHELKMLEAIQREQLEADTLDEVLDAEEKWWVAMVSLSGNLLHRLLYNSIRPLLRLVFKRHFQFRGARIHGEQRLSFFRYVMQHRPPVDELEQTYAGLMRAMTQLMRESILTPPEVPEQEQQQSSEEVHP